MPMVMRDTVNMWLQMCRCSALQSCWVNDFYYLIAYCMNKIIARQVADVITSKMEIRFYYWSLNLHLRWEESLVKCYIMRLIH
jgi:hypothetical protein